MNRNVSRIYIYIYTRIIKKTYSAVAMRQRPKKRRKKRAKTARGLVIMSQLYEAGVYGWRNTRISVVMSLIKMRGAFIFRIFTILCRSNLIIKKEEEEEPYRN